MSERLDRVEEILAGLAESHQASDARLTRMEANHELAMARLDRIEALTQSNARAIEALTNQQNEDRDETVNVELDILDRVSELRDDFYAGMNRVNESIGRLNEAVILLLRRGA